MMALFARETLKPKVWTDEELELRENKWRKSKKKKVEIADGAKTKGVDTKLKGKDLADSGDKSLD